jgi:hypothetical protein
VLAQVPQIEAQSARLTELTQPVAKLGQPPKTSDNSSVPPSQAPKASGAERHTVTTRKRRPGVFRTLTPTPTTSMQASTNATHTATIC